MEHELAQSKDGIVAHFIVRVAHQSGERRVEKRNKRLQNAVQRLHADGQNSGAKRLFGDGAVLLRPLDDGRQQSGKIRSKFLGRHGAAQSGQDVSGVFNQFLAGLRVGIFGVVFVVVAFFRLLHHLALGLKIEENQNQIQIKLANLNDVPLC